VDGDNVNLGWSHNAMTETCYRVYRSRDGGEFELVSGAVTCCYQDYVGDFHWNELTYCVTSLNDQGVESDFSAPATVSARGDDLPDIEDVDFPEQN